MPNRRETCLTSALIDNLIRTLNRATPSAQQIYDGALDTPSSLHDLALASMEVKAALETLEASSAPNKTASYNELLERILNRSKREELASNLTAYVESLLGESLGIVASRPLLASFVERLRSVDDPNIQIEVGLKATSLIAPKIVSYEEQDTQLKGILASAYEANEEYRSSAQTLQTITLDSTQRPVSADAKAAVWIRIVRCYLEEDDPTSATSYLNRVKNVLRDVTDHTTQLQFQLSQARILDAQRGFLDASSAYYTVSNEPAVDADERLQMLSAAIICAVLAPAGPAQARTLARLYKDDRAAQVEEFGILEKIFLERLLSPEEVRAFSEKLRPHQLARTADGSTVLDKAVLEHNLLAASRLYENIGTEELGSLLGVEADRAEGYAAQMIEQGRLAGYIDQIARRVVFEGEGSGEKIGTNLDRGMARDIRRWDANVLALTEEVERVTTLIQAHYPVSLIESIWVLFGPLLTDCRRICTLHIWYGNICGFQNRKGCQENSQRS